MRDPEAEDSGVRVGGDAYGNVRVPPRREVKSAKGARARRRGVVVTGALSAVVLASSGVLWAETDHVTGLFGSVDAGVAAVPASGAMNFLVVGVDRRDNLTRKQQNQLKLGREVGERTDTMMVIHLSEDHTRVTVVSLPRDTWTAIPGQGMHKINAAYQLGGGSKGKGADLAVKAVQSATGLRINHYVEVNVLGFIDVVDSLGGVSVCTPVAINDTKTGLALQPGTYELDGVKALAYARTRATARSDLDRIDRQQQVISALLKQALANPVRLSGFVSSAARAITVDTALSKDLVGLANQLRNVSTDDVTFAAVPLSDVDFKTPTGESAVLWDKTAAGDLFRRIDKDQPLAPKPSASVKPSASASPSAPALTVPPSSIAVRVTNGTTIVGIGARTKSELLKAGFLVPAPPGNTAQRGQVKTVIRYGPGREDSARTVAAAIPGAEVRQVDAAGIEVILGTDRLPVKKVTVAPPVRQPVPSATPTTRTATQNICKK